MRHWRSREVVGSRQKGALFVLETQRRKGTVREEDELPRPEKKHEARRTERPQDVRAPEEPRETNDCRADEPHGVSQRGPTGSCEHEGAWTRAGRRLPDRRLGMPVQTRKTRHSSSVRLSVETLRRTRRKPWGQNAYAIQEGEEQNQLQCITESPEVAPGSARDPRSAGVSRSA